jgi:hypothetical protein
LIANFKDTATLWAFLRASLRQCHIHKLSKVGQDKAAWANADEYLAKLMDSDTMLTLENTNDAIKRAENYMHRQDTDGDKRVSFSSAVDGSTDGQVNTLRAELKEKDQRLSALEAKFDSFSRGQTDGGNQRKKTAKKNEKECNYCKKTGKWFQGHDESECLHKKKDETEAGLLAKIVHDMWCHPGHDKMEQIYKARRGRGFPRGFIKRGTSSLKTAPHLLRFQR